MPLTVERPLNIALPDNGLLVAESVHGPGFRMGRERHGFHELYIVRQGHIQLEDERLQQPIRIEAGRLWPIPAGTQHRMEDTAESILLLVCISERHLRHWRDRERVWDSLVQRHEQPIRPDALQFEAIMDSLYRILTEQSSPRNGSAVLITAEIDRLLVLLARIPTSGIADSAEARVRHVVALLETHFFEPWDIDRAASRAHLSRRRFTSLFREITGETFSQRLGRLRIEHAKALLRDGRHSIPGAALASGIQDLSHFYRLFKREAGCAPGRWIRMQGGESEK